MENKQQDLLKTVEQLEKNDESQLMMANSEHEKMRRTISTSFGMVGTAIAGLGVIYGAVEVATALRMKSKEDAPKNIRDVTQKTEDGVKEDLECLRKSIFLTERELHDRNAERKAIISRIAKHGDKTSYLHKLMKQTTQISLNIKECCTILNRLLAEARTHNYTSFSAPLCTPFYELQRYLSLPNADRLCNLLSGNDVERVASEMALPDAKEKATKTYISHEKGMLGCVDMNVYPLRHNYVKYLLHHVTAYF